LKTELQKTYTRDESTRVWARPDFSSIAYSDGDDSETRLAESIAQVSDVSVLSAELRSHCVDWPSLYHLTPTRSNILRPFADTLRGRVLEIGAGCGAITRFLGENGGEILSLEGSYRRAAIAASRTRDLSNVNVLAERFDDFSSEVTFDAVTLIGVLEYAGMFSNATDPALHMLKRAWGLLAPGGRLIIAIENQLGLKYFAGAPEDHLGVPMYGVEGRYKPGQPQTFGRHVLTRLLTNAGFDGIEFLVPSPDYKVPNTILTEEGLAAPGFDAAALIWENVSKDPQLPPNTHFELQSVWPVVIRNGLGVEMANSFLVCASKQASEPAIAPGLLGFHYTTNRNAPFCRAATFARQGSDITVHYKGLADQPVEFESSQGYNRPTQVPYQQGHLLSTEFAKIVSQQTWTQDQVNLFIRRYIRFVDQLLRSEGHVLPEHVSGAQLPGHFLEATPGKIVIDKTDKPRWIAAEWYPAEPVTLGHLLTRAVIELLATSQPASRATPTTRLAFLVDCLAPLGWTVDAAFLKRYMNEEAKLHIARRGSSAAVLRTWAADSPLRSTYEAGLAQAIRTKVYIPDAAGELSERRTRILPLHHGMNSLHFDLSQFDIASLMHLRLDPVDTQCLFRIHKVELCQGDTTLWEWNGSLDALQQLADLVPVTGPDEKPALLATSADPHFFIPIVQSQLDGPLKLTVELELLSEDADQLALPTIGAVTSEVATTASDGTTTALHDRPKGMEASHCQVDERFGAANQALAAKDALLEARSAELKQLESTVVTTQSELNVLQEGMAASQHEITQLRETLESVQVDLNQARIELELSQHKLLSTEAEKMEAKRVHEALDKANNEIATMRDMLASVEAQSTTAVQGQASHRQALEQEVLRLQHLLQEQQVAKDTHIHNLNLQIIGLYTSTSWKVTAPLRKVTRSLRRLYKLYTVLPAIIRRGGGFSATLRKAYRVLTSQGISGLAGRVRWVLGASKHEFIGQETRPVVDRHDYSVWVEYYDTMDDNKRWSIKEVIRGFAKKPKISIIMPVYNPPLDLLREAIDSVRTQLYGEWELCIADDASTKPEIAQALQAFARQDKRIKVVFRPENGHISHASNSALELATGEFIALMDNDDLLPEHALYWVARTALENPDAGMFYSDEDKVDSHGKRTSPYFKSAWNAHLCRSQNMVCHLGVYRTDLVRSLGGFRPGFEGAQDYDLALRCADALKPGHIVHIPRVLYHWRIHEGSTALAGTEKPYAALAGAKALEEHLQRRHCKAEVQLLPTGMYRVHYEVPSPQPMVSLIIPTRNAEALVRQCIDSIVQRSTYNNYEIILVDNGSDDPSALAYFAALDQTERVRVIRDDSPFNYSALNNMAVRAAQGELIGLVNNDIEVITPNWLEEMVGLATLPEVGAVGARLWYPDDRLQHGGVIVGVGGVAGHSHKYLPKGDHGYFCRAELVQEFSAVTAACLVIRKSTFLAVEGLDEENLRVAFNDVDFCLRVGEAGYVNVWTPYSELYHHESATRGHEDTPEKQARFSKEVNHMKARWPNIQSDYCYSPNLTLNHEDFSLAWPPRVKI